MKDYGLNNDYIKPFSDDENSINEQKKVPTTNDGREALIVKLKKRKYQDVF